MKKLTQIKKRWLMVLFGAVWLIVNSVLAWLSIFLNQFEPTVMITACLVDGVVPMLITGVIGALEIIKDKN